jgi:hypothetical protein
MQVAGISDDDFVYTSFTNAALGTTPYIIVLHRWPGEGDCFSASMFVECTPQTGSPVMLERLTVLPRRPSRSVVLSVRGSNSMEDLLTDMMDRPLDITAWLPDDFKQASGGQLAQAWA